MSINAWNYGSIIQKFKTLEFQSQYKAIIIAHQVKNNLFKYEPNKNPVLGLVEKYTTGELTSCKIIKENSYFTFQKQVKLLEAMKII